MKNGEVLTNKEKRLLQLSAQADLTLQEELEFAGLKKQQTQDQVKSAERGTLSAGALVVAMLPTLYAPSLVLPVAVCLGELGYLAYRERTDFKKIKAKAHYYFNVLNSGVKGNKSQEERSEEHQKGLNASDSVSKKSKQADNLDLLFGKKSWDIKNALGRDLKDEYFSFKQSRIETFALAAGALAVGLFFPQDLFLGFCLCSAGLATLFSKAEANIIKENRLSYWTKREEDLKAQLQNRTRSQEKQPQASIEPQTQGKKIAHQQKKKISDKDHQREG